jgi:hypothetical protein
MSKLVPVLAMCRKIVWIHFHFTASLFNKLPLEPSLYSNRWRIKHCYFIILLFVCFSVLLFSCLWVSEFMNDLGQQINGLSFISKLQICHILSTEVNFLRLDNSLPLSVITCVGSSNSFIFTDVLLFFQQFMMSGSFLLPSVYHLTPGHLCLRNHVYS